MEFMPVKVNKAIRSEKKHFFFDFKYLKSRSLPVKHAKKYRSPIAGLIKIPTFAPGEVLYGQLPSNPPGLDRSKGSWL